MAIQYLDGQPSSNIQYLDNGPNLESVQRNVEQLEPGIYGETDPIEQRLLGNVAAVGKGYGVGQLVGMGATKFAGTNLGKAILISPKALGEQYAAQNEVADISGELPVRWGRLPNYPKSSTDLGDLQTAKNLMLNPPVSYPKDPAAIINLAKNRIEAFGPELTNQELDDYDSMLGTMSKLGKYRVEAMAGKGAWGLLGDTQAKVSDLLSQGVTQAIKDTPYWPQDYEPTRESLNQVYALSKKLRIAPELASKIWSYLGPKFRWGDIFIQ